MQMKKIILIGFVFASLSKTSEAQIIIQPQPFISSNGVAVGPILLTDGTASAPPLASASFPTIGMRIDATNVYFNPGGSNPAAIRLNNTPAILLGSNAGFFSLGAGDDTQLSRASAGNFQLAGAWNIGSSGIIDQGSHVITAGGLVTGNGFTSSAGAITSTAGTTVIAPLVLTNGTNLTSATANAIENDGAAFYTTNDTTNGRRYSDGWNYFRLTGSGSGITTIADFFGTNDGIPLVANGIYEIEWYCFFSQATAGTATWTVVTATTALANITGEYDGSNIAGIGAVGANQVAAINTTASSSTAFPVTGTEATGATHYFKIRVLVTAGNGASNTRLKLTMGAGTATPLINSYFRVRRLSGANVGTFVA